MAAPAIDSKIKRMRTRVDPNWLPVRPADFAVDNPNLSSERRAFRFLVWAISGAFRARVRLAAENLCQRQQSLVLQREIETRRSVPRSSA